MAEYTRGQESRRVDDSGHNTNRTANTRQRLQGVDFEEMNFEQRRAPYGNSGRGDRGENDDAGLNRSGRRRDEF